MVAPDGVLGPLADGLVSAAPRAHNPPAPKGLTRSGQPTKGKGPKSQETYQDAAGAPLDPWDPQLSRDARGVTAAACTRQPSWRASALRTVFESTPSAVPIARKLIPSRRIRRASSAICWYWKGSVENTTNSSGISEAVRIGCRRVHSLPTSAATPSASSQRFGFSGSSPPRKLDRRSSRGPVSASSPERSFFSPGSASRS